MARSFRRIYRKHELLIVHRSALPYVGTLRVSLTVQDGLRLPTSSTARFVACSRPCLLSARFVACRRPCLLSQDSRVTREPLNPFCPSAAIYALRSIQDGLGLPMSSTAPFVCVPSTVASIARFQGITSTPLPILSWRNQDHPKAICNVGATIGLGLGTCS